MINYIWGVFILLGVIISIIKGDNNLTNNLITSGTKGIDIIIKFSTSYVLMAWYYENSGLFWTPKYYI